MDFLQSFVESLAERGHEASARYIALPGPLADSRLCIDVDDIRVERSFSKREMDLFIGGSCNFLRSQAREMALQICRKLGISENDPLMNYVRNGFT